MDSASPNLKQAEDDQSDLSIMQRLVAGQESALNELMERHGQRLFHFLIRALQNEAEAEDLAEETFVRLYQSRHRYDPRKKFSTWLYAIASNLARDRIRWRKRHPNVSLESEIVSEGTAFADILPDDYNTPAQQLEEKERDFAVRRAIALLPEELRLPLLLAEYEEKRHAEIAVILDCSIKAVETRIYRARQRLRVSLAKILEGG